MKRRNTEAKDAIFNILESAEGALSQEAIEEKLKGKMNRVTVYRVLNSFCEDGYIHKVLSDEGKSYFAICLTCNEEKHHHDHFHFRCISCRKVECLKEDVKVKIPRGYVVQQVNCLLTGYCKDCA